MPVALLAPSISPAIDPSSLGNSAAIDGLYVHVPFCFHKCHYCDFYSITRQSAQRMNRFVDLVLREAELWTASGAVIQPRTIFFGGGTPTLLPPAEMHRLLVGLRERFDLSAVDEWTSEANPATVDLDYCQLLRDGGVNRLSFGAQTFDRRELAMLERHHDPDDVPRSVTLARQAGFERINVDLIYAIPGQSLDSWVRSLDAALALGVGHLSCYGLTYERNTPIAVKRRLGLLREVGDERELEMLRYTRRRLRDAGLPPYEISNYAAAGEECRHNLMYWNGGNYIGLGPSAASHVGGTRFKSRPHLGEWEDAIERGALAATDVETLAPAERVSELAMLQLRLARGICWGDLDALDDSTAPAHTRFAGAIEQLLKLRLIVPTQHGVRLTDAGVEVADAIALEFID